MKLFTFLRGRIISAGYENRELAKDVGCSENHLSRCLNGHADFDLPLQHRIIEKTRGKTEEMHLYFPKNGIA